MALWYVHRIVPIPTWPCGMCTALSRYQHGPVVCAPHCPDTNMALWYVHRIVPIPTWPCGMRTRLSRYQHGPVVCAPHCPDTNMALWYEHRIVPILLDLKAAILCRLVLLIVSPALVF
ncbi:hypothetical protein BgiMline_031042 [Biomphalaria glabrata]